MLVHWKIMVFKRIVKRPSFQFYPADWRVDSSLQICTLQARGLWMELLCLMHEIGQREGARYGFLEMNGKALENAQIARLVGIDSSMVSDLLNELLGAGVCSEEDGIIYSRRMSRDDVLKQKRTDAGSKGGSKLQAKAKQTIKQNPSKPSSKTQANHQANHQANFKQKVEQNTSKGAHPRARAEVEVEEEEEVEVEVEEEENIKSRKQKAYEVVELYHLLCPSMIKCKTLTDKRIAHINARLSEKVDFQELFIKAEASNFLAGRSEKFKAEISFLINPENCAKTLEGKYDTRENPRTEEVANYSEPF